MCQDASECEATHRPSEDQPRCWREECGVALLLDGEGLSLLRKRDGWIPGWAWLGLLAVVGSWLAARPSKGKQRWDSKKKHEGVRASAPGYEVPCTSYFTEKI